MIIDTHIHLDDKRYSNDLDEVLKRAKQNGVEKYIIPGASPKDLPRALELSEKYNDIYFAVGVHPYDSKSYDKNYLKKFITHKKCVGVGECGLDYYRLPKDEEKKDEEKKLQIKVFVSQIELSIEFELPLIVHIREANQDSFEILKSYQKELKKGGVLHCYNASEMLLGLSDNFYYGIGGVSTFKNAKNLIEIIPKIPKDRILIETDGPYLTPHPHRGERNEPSYCVYVADKLSELLNISRDEIDNLSTLNAKKLFGLL